HACRVLLISEVEGSVWGRCCRLARPCFSQGAFLGRTWILLTLGSVWAQGGSHLPLCFWYRIRCGRPAVVHVRVRRVQVEKGGERQERARLRRSDLGSRPVPPLFFFKGIPDILIHLLCLSAGSASSHQASDPLSSAAPTLAAELDWALVSQKSSEDLAPPSLLLNCISFLITQCPHPRWLPG
ncbi:uncharacterized protein LOC105738606, partial [Nomascus leucogenys]|uniref:uncharacterized protein LOC105738606 n=1 Tax=Nomascus leucogenys TaxID=61853 RepID=UPI00122D6D9A